MKSIAERAALLYDLLVIWQLYGLDKSLMSLLNDLWFVYSDKPTVDQLTDEEISLYIDNYIASNSR